MKILSVSDKYLGYLSSQAKEAKIVIYSLAQPQQKPERKIKLYTYKIEKYKYDSNAKEELIKEIAKQAHHLKMII